MVAQWVWPSLGVVVDRTGDLLVADDTGNATWHVWAQ